VQRAWVDEALHSVAHVVRRGELTDAQWAKLEPLLPPRKPKTGKPNKDLTGARGRERADENARTRTRGRERPGRICQSDTARGRRRG
jgi:transposase